MLHPVRSPRLGTPPCMFRASGVLQLTRENPSAIHVSGEHRQKDCTNQCNQGCDDRSAVTAEAGEAHRESAHDGPTNTHEDVHKWTITITLENSSGSPAYYRPNDNPCKQVHTFLLLSNPKLTFRRIDYLVSLLLRIFL